MLVFAYSVGPPWGHLSRTYITTCHVSSVLAHMPRLGAASPVPPCAAHPNASPRTLGGSAYLIHMTSSYLGGVLLVGPRVKGACACHPWGPTLHVGGGPGSWGTGAWLEDSFPVSRCQSGGGNGSPPYHGGVGIGSTLGRSLALVIGG